MRSSCGPLRRVACESLVPEGQQDDVVAGTARLFLGLMRQSWEQHGANSIGVGASSYVQWAKFSGSLVIEVSADQFRREEERFSFAQRRRLQLLGFQPPQGEVPNHWRVFDSVDELPEAALTLARAVHEVCYVSAGSALAP